MGAYLGRGGQKPGVVSLRQGFAMSKGEDPRSHDVVAWNR